MAEETKTGMFGNRKVVKTNQGDQNVDVFGYPISKDDPRLFDRDCEDARAVELMVLYGGPKVGMMTNPDSYKRPNHIMINGEKVVCRAQGGECRQYGEFYSPVPSETGSWKTPVISHRCPDSCPYKYLVCDGHDHSPNEDVGIFIPYPHYNKFCGQYTRYCRDFDRIRQPVKDEKEPDEPGSDTSRR
ncbi:MAG: hypothetical protein KAS66_00090 [Candidatus Omnitrophica bacterium]|nr:hypothetical protein [Candidatus Omnitrophota bacterium]